MPTIAVVPPALRARIDHRDQQIDACWLDILHAFCGSQLDIDTAEGRTELQAIVSDEVAATCDIENIHDGWRHDFHREIVARAAITGWMWVTL